MVLSVAELESIRAHAERAYPNESCGMVMQSSLGRVVLYGENVHEDPHVAYRLSPFDQVMILRHERTGFELVAIYHSHPDAAAYFSGEDRKAALDAKGRPTYPGVTYVVTAVIEGAATITTAFRWSDDARDFLEVEMLDDARVPLPGTPAALVSAS